MTKHFTLLLFILFMSANVLFAQELVFTQNGKELSENTTIYCSEIDIMGNMNPHIYVKNTGSEISASLTITVMEEHENGSIGFCGWGTNECMPVPYGFPVTRTTTIAANQEADPHLEAMNIDPSNTLIKVQYKLAYADKEKILNVVFTTNPTGISSPNKELDITLYHKDERVCMDYNFPTNHTRKVLLYNIIGKKVAEYTLTDETNTLTFPQLPKGIYMYSIMENNQSVKCGKYIF